MNELSEQEEKVLWTIIAIMFFAVLCGVPCFIGYRIGIGKGYIQALDDIRLGKPAKYKLVKTAEKWVEVER